MTVATKGVTRALADYALTLEYESIPPAVIERTKQLFLDFLGVAFGGHRVAESTSPIVAAVRDLVCGARGATTVVGEPDLYPPHYGALLNATKAHSMDFDDTHREAIMHPGAPIFATLLALAEEEGSSGKEFLAAAVAGYDVANKLGKAHGASVHHRGFHPTATTGIFACTAAGARILKLPRDQAINALGLNSSQSAGSQQFLINGAWNKRLHVGLAAHNAILSLFMARRGFLGSAEPIEGAFGYFALYTNEPRDPAAALVGLGEDFEVLNTATKPYPCCRYSHAVIDAVTDLVRDNRLSSGDILRIEVQLGKTAYLIVGDSPEAKRKPSNVVEAQFSVYFAAAATVVSTFRWDSYETMHAPDVRALMERTTVEVASDLDGMASRTAIVTHDGRRLEREVPLPKGEPENPMSQAEAEAKFIEWTEPVLGPRKTQDLARQVAGLERLGTMAELTRSLRLQAPSTGRR